MGMETTIRLSERVQQAHIMHNGVEMTIGQVLQLAENSTSDVEMMPYLMSLMFFASQSNVKGLWSVCQQLKTKHGGKPFSMPPTSEKILDKGSKKILKLDDFCSRVKKIVTKAAERNGERISTRSRGHDSAYIYNIDATRFCAAIERMEEMHYDKLCDYLGGDMGNVQISKVGMFIGFVIREQIINDQNLMMKDLTSAFEDYQNPATVLNYLSCKKYSDDDLLCLQTFIGVLKSTQRPE
jgi:hypothetical protein